MRLPFLMHMLTKFVLEVCGAAGAIWGSSEVATLRNKTTQQTWRYISSAVGVLFLGRFVVYGCAQWKKMQNNVVTENSNKEGK